VAAGWCGYDRIRGTRSRGERGAAYELVVKCMRNECISCPESEGKFNDAGNSKEIGGDCCLGLKGSGKGER